MVVRNDAVAAVRVVDFSVPRAARPEERQDDERHRQMTRAPQRLQERGHMSA
jgi:hypothetical protein